MGSAMTPEDHILRRRLLREIEGFLDLINAAGDTGTLASDHRKSLAERALRQLDRLSELGPPRSTDLYLRGEAYRLSDQYEPAVECLRQSLEKNANHLGAYVALGWCFKRLGRIPLAIAALEEALQVDAASAIVHYNLACYWALLNSPHRAAFHLSEALDLQPAYLQLVPREPDFDLVRQNPEFVAAMNVTA